MLTNFIPSYIQGDSLQNLSSGLDTISYRVPLGVCAGIAPFNFPGEFSVRQRIELQKSTLVHIVTIMF